MWRIGTKSTTRTVLGNKSRKPVKLGSKAVPKPLIRKKPVLPY
jgi:hypothetical protein